MGLKEIVLGSNWEQKSRSEKLARLSKLVDVASIFAGLLLLGFAPAVANAMIQASVVTYAGAEVYDRHKQRKKKK